MKINLTVTCLDGSMSLNQRKSWAGLQMKGHWSTCTVGWADEDTLDFSFTLQFEETAGICQMLATGLGPGKRR